MCSCNVLAIKQRKINFGRHRSVVDNLRLVWVIQKGQAGQVLSCKRGELKRENLFLYHSLRKRIKFLLRTVLLAICCLILQIGFPNGATWIYLLLLLNNLGISAPAPQQIGYLLLLPFYVFAPPTPPWSSLFPTPTVLLAPLFNIVFTSVFVYYCTQFSPTPNSSDPCLYPTPTLCVCSPPQYFINSQPSGYNHAFQFDDLCFSQSI